MATAQRTIRNSAKTGTVTRTQAEQAVRAAKPSQPNVRNGGKSSNARKR